MKIATLILSIFTLLLHVALSADDSYIKTKSFYWDFDMSNPKISSEAFVNAMGNENYAKAFFYLHYETQGMACRASMMSDFDFYGSSNNWSDFILDTHVEQELQLNSAIYSFDQAMGYLKLNGGSYINWWQKWKFTKVHDLQKNRALCEFTSLDGKAKIFLILKTTPSNRWKILYVKRPSDQGLIFWPKAFDENAKRVIP